MSLRSLILLTLLASLSTAFLPERAEAQVPLRTFSVTTEEPETTDEYAVEFSYTHLPSPKGYTDIECYFHSYDTNLYMWKSGFKIIWNSKSLKFDSYRSDENLLSENLSEFAPEYGLSIRAEFEKKEDSVLIVYANPVREGRRTQLFRTYYLGTFRFKILNSKLSDNFRFEPFGAHFYSSSGKKVSDAVTYEIQEWQYETE